MAEKADLFVDAVLVNRPDGGHVSVEQLGERQFLVARSGANETGLADGRVADHDALDQLLVRQFVIHHRYNSIGLLFLRIIFNYFFCNYFSKVSSIE